MNGDKSFFLKTWMGVAETDSTSDRYLFLESGFEVEDVRNG